MGSVVEDLFDVAIIGGGVVGCAIARELSRYCTAPPSDDGSTPRGNWPLAHILLLESEEEVGYGTSKANSGIVHPGHHSSPKLKKGQFVVKGNAMFDELARELGFGFKRIGEIVVACSEDDIPVLEEMKRLGEDKGVPGLEMWDAARLQKEEPTLCKDLCGGLYAPSAGVVNSYELVLTLAESAVQNGVVLKCNSPVKSIALDHNGVADVADRFLELHTPHEVFRAKFVINAAGVSAGDVERMVGLDNVHIKPRKGEEYLLDKSFSKNLPSHVIFPCPTPTSKGILVIPTVDGTTMVGPTAEDIEDPTDLNTTTAGCEKVFAKVRQYCPQIHARYVIASFAGLRAADRDGDFCLGLTDVKGFLNCAAIQSPGLTSAPALALHMIEQLQQAGLALALRSPPAHPPFVPEVVPQPKFADLSPDKQAELAKENTLFARVVCRCELVTEGDVHAAIDRGARSLDSIKFRTRAGMGRCQGGFCTSRVMEILAARLGVPIHEITKRGPESPLVYRDLEDIGTPVVAAHTADPRKPTEHSSPEKIAAPRTVAGSGVVSCAVDLSSDRRVWDVAVIGGGPAGLAAGFGAREAGAENVLVLDREPTAGGILLQCIHSGFGLKYFKKELTGPEYAERFFDLAMKQGVCIIPNSFVFDITREERGGQSLRVLAGNAKEGRVVEVRARATVLAMGCRERTRAAIRIPGSRPAGVYTAGLAQKLMNEGGGLLPGRRVAILGSGDIGLIMARRLTLEGCKVVGVWEILPMCSGLKRNLVQCLYDYKIPLHVSHTVLEVHGKDRVEGITVAPVDSAFHPDRLNAEYVECDALLLSVGLLPENELSNAVGVELARQTGGPVVRSTLMTSVPGVFAAGNVLHVHDIVDNVSAEGLIAGKRAGEYAALSMSSGKAPVPPPEKVLVEAGEGVSYVLPATLDPGQPQKLSFRVTNLLKPARVVVEQLNAKDQAELVVMDKNYQILLPAEMVSLELKPGALTKLEEAVKNGSLVRISVRVEASRARRTAAGPVDRTALCGETGCSPTEIEESVYTCVGCPKGCALHVLFARKDSELAGKLVEKQADNVLTVFGNDCKRGAAYAKQEHRDPRRGFSTSVRLTNCPTHSKVAVKLSSTVPKGRIMETVDAIHALSVEAPVQSGQVIAHNLLGLEGLDVVAVRTLRACAPGEKAKGEQ